MIAGKFHFEPIAVNEIAPGGARILRTFDDIGAFILTHVDVGRRVTPHWSAVLHDFIQARFGARQAQVSSDARCAIVGGMAPTLKV
jgi:hypothetical protein